jgi:hypothetical protein
VVPRVPPPRYPRWYVASGVEIHPKWYVASGVEIHPKGEDLVSMIDGYPGPTLKYSWEVARRIGNACGWQPRKVLRALRRLQAIAAWCRARRAGLERAAQEILRQQARAMEQLEAEAAMAALQRQSF